MSCHTRNIRPAHAHHPRYGPHTHTPAYTLRCPPTPSDCLRHFPHAQVYAAQGAEDELREEVERCVDAGIDLQRVRVRVRGANEM